MNKNNKKKVVLAYSGGLDTSAIIPWIKEKYKFEVIAFIADIGQSEQDLIQIKKKALQSGAISAYVYDLKEEFVKKYIYPVLHTGALYEGEYLLGTAMARPIIAKKQIELALQLNAHALCHGATGKGNDQVRFENVYTTFAPQLQIIAPWREWDLNSRSDIINYLKKKNIPTEITFKKIYSRDENIWHVSTEGGILENIWNQPKKDCWCWTTDPILAPNTPEEIHLKIKNGYIISINEKKYSYLKSLKKLNQIGSKHGIGRIDIVENRLIGMKSRGCYETPGGSIIVKALQSLDQLILDRESLKWKKQVGLEMSYTVYDGKWFSPLNQSLIDSMKSFTKRMTGEIVIQLFKGNITVLKKKSPYSLYSETYASFEDNKNYNHTDAQGFIRIFTLPAKIRALKNKNKN
ncbi:argininosuccinate synthase [Buchnera aphidicola (Thelaxes californica)]|uniref:Argininosuccinate synthase n=1 Tax=Buchnera aphidicola (Thelaxes californica) TaxID=1315998 RepID=A0A4D6YB22_9GAMM|nr:argininosuccinate synthase [Buchnera aphidicola]QCI26599.1 argininosuccinate synthase [Buchnera aphidicola (Thelaxes californica)]